MSGTTQEIDKHIARLHSNGRLRVWSLIVTFFGDAVALRGGRVGLAVLQDMMGLLDIEQGAVRTAMSRLAKDGWVERTREGRLSFYELSPQGRFAFDEATRRIYASGPPEWDGTWTVAVSAGSHDSLLKAQGFVPLGGRAWLTAGSADTSLPPDILLVRGRGTDFPPELSGLWQLEGLADHYRRFISDWQDFDPATGSLSAAGSMAARTLLIHDWRRIVLRDPDLPGTLLPAGWPGTKAHQLVQQIYRALLQDSEMWLDETGLPAATDAGNPACRFIALRNIA